MKRTLASRPRRRQVLMLVPSVPSPGLSRSEKELYRALTAVSGAHALLCVPEDKPLSARLDEAALASRGAEVYSFHAEPRAEISGRLKTLITANPALDVIGFAGLEALRSHLVDARLFAPSKAFFAVLGAGDLAALRSPGPGGTAPGEANRRLLSCCDAVFCAEASGAQFLRGRFGAAAHRYDALPLVISSLGRGGALKPERLGLLYRAKAPGPGGAFRAARKKALPPGIPFFAAVNRAVFGAPADIALWAVVSGNFVSCSALWERLANACRVFPDAGLVLPAAAEFAGPAGGRPPAAALEALSLARQGNHGEPLLVDDLPVVILRSAAFRSVGGFDERFISPSCAWTDLGLRMRQAGHAVISAGDAVVCAPAHPAAPGDIDLLTHKWCAEGLKVMELLAFELGGRQP